MGKSETAEHCARAKGVMKRNAGMAEPMPSWKDRNGELEGQVIRKLMQVKA